MVALQLSREDVAGLPPVRVVAPSRRPIITASRVEFLAFFALYLMFGAVLVFHYHSVVGDALSRVGNGYYVFFSRDPKLAAVGFVWTPLPSILTMPLLPLKAFWPQLVSFGFAANIVSAACMAGAVVVLRGILSDIGVRPNPRTVITVLFALQPMIFWYGANGMSEALLILLLLLTVRYLGRWLRIPNTRTLACCGLVMALAYFARYEAVASGLAAIAVVAATSWLRSDGGRRQRRDLAMADGALIAAPFVAAVLIWMAASWAIVGHPFETFASRYGNTAQVSAAAGGIRALTGGHMIAAFWFSFRQILAIAPALPVVLVVACVFAWRRRDAVVVAPIAVLGSVLAFQALAFAQGGSFGWLRFQITAIPLLAILVGTLPVFRSRVSAPALARNPSASRRVRPSAFARNTRARRRLRRTTALAGAGVALAAGIPTTFFGFTDPHLAREERELLVPALQRALGEKHPSQGGLAKYVVERHVSAFLDRMRLPSGSVLTDVAIAFPVVLASSHPRQFVITPDKDFPTALAHPVSSGIRFLLVSKEPGGLDAVTAAYPSLFADGAGIARLYAEFTPPFNNGATWRLYETVPSSASSFHAIAPPTPKGIASG